MTSSRAYHKRLFGVLLKRDGQHRHPAREFGAAPAPVIDLAWADTAEAGKDGLADAG
jgi:hypothetical protein